MPLLEAIYINHNGQHIEFGKGDGLFLNQHDLFNFGWNVQTRGNRIISLNRKGVKEHTLPIVIVAPTESQANKFANDLFAICEEDLQANKKGRLVVNGYSLECFIYGQEYSEWSDASKILKISAKVVKDSLWYKILEPITFNADSSQTELPEEAEIISALEPGSEKGYDHDYPYDYPETREEYVYENTHGVSLSWDAVIYGAASVIAFEIGGHTYAVPDVTLAHGESLEITAKEALDEKTVVKVHADGTRENCFVNRSSESYLFEPIRPGNQLIRYENGLVWELTPIIERSAPEWL